MSVVHEHVTCLGCGLSCDDVTVTTEGGRITDIRNGCDRGRSWFGSGVVPDAVRSRDRSVELEQALSDAARLLASARRPLVYLAPELSVDAQRAAVAIADRLHAVLDSTTSLAAESVLATQRRGRIGATLGDVRRRADLIVFWGVDPAERWPRYVSRVVNPEQEVALVAVDVGAHQGLSSAPVRFAVEPALEVPALGVLRATVAGRVPALAEDLQSLVDLGQRMLRARYVVVVHETDMGDQMRDSDRFEALIALVQTLNGPTRAALSSLGAGGNAAGAAQVVTWQTGFPMTVDFGSGYPTYRPDEIAGGEGWNRELDAVLIAGDAGSLPQKLESVLDSLPVVLIGPRASTARRKPTVLVDTGVPGIHESGMAFRMDDVPLPLTAVLESNARSTVAVLTALLNRLGA